MARHPHVNTELRDLATYRHVPKTPAVDPADWRRSGPAGGTGALLHQHVYSRSMSLNQTLTRARACVQRGQVDSAIKLYRGLLVSMAHHPQINTELGVLLL